MNVSVSNPHPGEPIRPHPFTVELVVRAAHENGNPVLMGSIPFDPQCSTREFHITNEHFLQALATLIAKLA